MSYALPRRSTPTGGFTIIELMVMTGIAAVMVSILSVGIRRVGESFALRRAGTR